MITSALQVVYERCDITCLNVNKLLLISMHSFCNLILFGSHRSNELSKVVGFWFFFSVKCLLRSSLSDPARSTSCSFPVTLSFGFLILTLLTQMVNIVWLLELVLFIEWDAIILLEVPSWNSLKACFAFLSS